MPAHSENWGYVCVNLNGGAPPSPTLISGPSSMHEANSSLLFQLSHYDHPKEAISHCREEALDAPLVLKMFAEGPRFGSSLANCLNPGSIDRLPKFRRHNRMVTDGYNLESMDPHGSRAGRFNFAILVM